MQLFRFQKYLKQDFYEFFIKISLQKNYQNLLSILKAKVQDIFLPDFFFYAK